MAGEESKAPQSRRVGDHWSGANPIPTIHNFMEHIDSEKKERDRRIDEENRIKKEEAARKKAGEDSGEQPEAKDGDVVAHKAREVSQAKVRTVTDPTTGKDIGVEDQDETSMETVKNPTVCRGTPGSSVYSMLMNLQLTVPNANIGKPTVRHHSMMMLAVKLTTTEWNPNPSRPRARRV